MENIKNQRIKLKMTKLEECSVRLKSYRYIVYRKARGPEILEVEKGNVKYKTVYLFC